ncbi:baseplate J/gp47 family protein [Periweissella cryptocerci]|uniref:Baseplate J/gp47 family protein n=1 Tax=Periweissella cryptocerci TaxID=2506420 RepID=A0A4P6YWK6_9LACO|nr:baseplate J/gp47 family protein [Periweissella cryptocerci]QBO37289.1 baseplate J/gp47 family protein [Periweissella cryptocerci]
MTLTDVGFDSNDYEDVLERLEEYARQEFGEDVQLSSSSVIGMLLRVLAGEFSYQAQDLEDVYNAGFVSKSAGITLDRLAANYGLERKNASSATVTLEFHGTPSYTIEEGLEVQSISGETFMVAEDVILDANGLGTAFAYAQSVGIGGNVGAGTITVQSEPLDDVTSVNNPQAASGGQEEETDKEFRARLKSNLSAMPGTSINGLMSALMNIDGVAGVKVVQNSEDEPNENNQPPKSIHAHILGGTNDEIANTLLNHVSAGVVTVGQEVVELQDISGTTRRIRFSRAVPVPISVHVGIVEPEYISEDQISRIKQNVVDYIGNVGMGQTILVGRLNSCVYRVDGIENAFIGITREDDELSSRSIDLGSYQVAQISVNEVVVEHA